MKLGRRSLLALAALAASPLRAAADFGLALETVPLWPGGVPGRGAALPAETLVERSAASSRPDRAVHGIADPRLLVVRPARPDGSAVLLCPGGGYRRIVVDREGHEVARWLADRGITAFLLFYRLPAEGWATGSDTPLIDAQRALRLIRAQAPARGLDPARIGVLGFSAGGHLAADLGARFASALQPPQDRFDEFPARPDFVALIYPVIALDGPLAHQGSREKLIGADAPADRARRHDPSFNVAANAPPHFLVHAEDDTSVPPGNSLRLREALKARGVPVELHLFETGGHGFGLAPGKPAAAWPDLFLAWVRAQGSRRS
jgi:acetyl esterase/lipase